MYPQIYLHPPGVCYRGEAQMLSTRHLNRLFSPVWRPLILCQSSESEGLYLWFKWWKISVSCIITFLFVCFCMFSLALILMNETSLPPFWCQISPVSSVHPFIKDYISTHTTDRRCDNPCSTGLHTHTHTHRDYLKNKEKKIVHKVSVWEYLRPARHDDQESESNKCWSVKVTGLSPAQFCLHRAE